MLPCELTRQEQRLLQRLAKDEVVPSRANRDCLEALAELGLASRIGGFYQLTIRGQIAASQARSGWLERIGLTFG